MTQKQDNLERYNTEFTFEGVKLIFYFEFLTENSNNETKFNIFHTHDMAELFVCTGPFIYVNTESGIISLSRETRRRYRRGCITAYLRRLNSIIERYASKRTPAVPKT